MREISFRNDILPLKDKLYRLALRITLNSAEAEDVVQDTMIRVWNKRDEWPNFESIEAYCLTVARNLAIDECRKSTKFTELDEEQLEQPDNMVKSLENKDTALQIHLILHELDEPYKEVFQLRIFGELPFSQIGMIFGKTENWARVTYHRARLKIKERMDRNE